VERLDPLCRGGDAGNPFGKQPSSFVKGPPLGVGSSSKATPLSSSLSAGSLKAPASSSGLPPFPELGPLPREKSSKSQTSLRQASLPVGLSTPKSPPAGLGSPARQRARNFEASPSRDTQVRSQGHNPGIDSVDRTPMDDRGSALAAELGGGRSSVPEEQSEKDKNAVKCRAVASLQRLFFEEVQRGGDANAAAAVALKRLAEETRPSDLPSSRSHHTPGS